MDIKKNLNGTALNVAIYGRVDTTTAPALEKELKESFDNCDSLVLDFAEVEYISSAGLRVLLTAQKNISKVGSMKLIHVADVIMDVFNITGFSDILTIE